MNSPALPLSRGLRIRAELKELLTLAAPIMIAQLATTAMGFVDAVMAGRASPHDLAAVALGNSIWIPMFLLMTGTLLATTAKVAQRHGAGDQPGTGPLVRQALWLALLIGPLSGAVLWWLSEPILGLMKVRPELIGPSLLYLKGIALGFPAAALYHVLRCYTNGLGRTRPSMVLGIGGLLLNIPINYALIYGHFGMPKMGGPGCGWATGSVMWFMFLGMLFWVNKASIYRASQLFSRWEWPDRATIGPLVAVGLPIGIAVFAESSIFSVIALLIGGLDENVVAGHQIALNFSALVFMIPHRRLADRVLRAVPVLRRPAGHRRRGPARLPGHPGDDDHDPVRLLGHRPAGGLQPRPHRLVPGTHRTARPVAGPGGGPDRRGDHALHPPGAQRAALHPPARAPAAGGRGGRLSPWPVAPGRRHAT